MQDKENREVKNRVFVELFYADESAEENDIALFNAIHDEPLSEGTIIRRFKVDTTIYMHFQNDISFDAGGKLLVFGEHQSTVNENMPFRSLLYIGRACEQIVVVRDRYKRKRVPLPTPEFYTFYNGKEKGDKEKELRLSDAYMVKDFQPMLDLKVKMINVNSSEQHEILERCQVLREYSQFIDMVTKYQETDVSEPYKKAIQECIRKGILAEYLKRKGSEVVNMLTAEYDYEMDIEVQREEAFESGKELGVELGLEVSRELYVKLKQLGRTDDILKAIEDSEYQKKMLKEFGL